MTTVWEMSDLTKPERDAAEVESWHFHVYFDKMTRPLAMQLRDRATRRFPDIFIGRVHDEPVGPYTAAMFMLGVKPEEFAEIFSWMALNARGLSVLVHPETGDEVADHTMHASWMGERLPIKEWALRKGVRNHPRQPEIQPI